MPDKNDYPYIKAWGQMLGSYDYYVRGQIEQARADGAPANATHRRNDGTWATTDDITRAETRRQLGLEPLPPQPPELTRMVALLQDALRHEAELVERFGMTEIATEGEDALVVRFSTGWAARIVIELLMSAQPS